MSKQPRKGDRLYTVGDFWLVPPDEKYTDYGTKWYDKSARQTRRVGTGKTDLEDAKDELKAHALKHGDGQHKDELVLQTLERYYLAYAVNLPTGKSVKQTIKFVMLYWPEQMASAIDADTQKRFITKLRDYGLSEDTIGRYFNNIFAAIRYAMQFKHLKFKVTPVRLGKRHWGVRTQARMRKSTKAAKRQLSPQEWGALFDAALEKGDHCVRYLITAIGTHARPAAILELTGAQIDAQHGTIDLNPAGREQNNKHRPIIPMARTLAAWVSSWAPGPGDLVITENGGPVALKQIRTLIEHARIGPCVPYTFRHSVASWLSAQAIDRWERKSFMGHTVVDGGKTDDYTHYDPRYLRNAAEAIERLYEAIAPHTRVNLLRATLEDQGPPEALWAALPPTFPVVLDQRRTSVLEACANKGVTDGMSLGHQG